ncbi:MAG: hypothetical protein V1793_06165 [Pseudomonadota bacterium]
MDNSHTKNTNDVWYYIIVQNPGTGDEELMGFEDTHQARTFIPVFNTKEEAQQCFLLMPKDIMKNKYEVQAIIQEDVLVYARKHGFSVYLLDDRSTIQGQVL